jgi:hypothetical protein
VYDVTDCDADVDPNRLVAARTPPTHGVTCPHDRLHLAGVPGRRASKSAVPDEVTTTRQRTVHGERVSGIRYDS